MENFVGLGIRNLCGEKTLDVGFPLIDFSHEKSFIEKLLKLLNFSSATYQLTTLNQTNLETINQAVNEFASLTSKEKNLLTFFTTYLNKVAPSPGDYLKKDLILIYLPSVREEVKNIEEAYFKLHLLSARKLKPHQANLGNLFKTLPNLAWSNQGPILPNDLAELKLKNPQVNYQITHVDKFPYLINYYLPDGVRIADGARVRLGAYLGKGTTVMPAGAVNFNAGTLGSSMVEGRISAGVVVGEQSDIGGGASIMGTLSGGNDLVISIGEKCLIGANAGTGISLGFGCTIAAGVYVTAGSKVHLYDKAKQPISLAQKPVKEGENIVKGLELSGKDHLLFIQDSQSGKLKCFPNLKTIALNESLHSHN